MKYRNKDTGVIVEAMQIKCDSAQDILDFGDGMVRSIENGGLSFETMCVYSLELKFPYIDQFGEHKVHTHYIDCQAGDYLIKKDKSIFALGEKEFKEQFETVEEENNNMKINLNDEVKVKLTDKALEILKENHKALNRIILKNGGKPDKFPYKPDENGYYTFQLWQLFEDFGEHISCGCEMPFTDGEIIKIEKESKAVEADERTITKDIFDPIENAKVGTRLTAKLNIDLKKGIKLIDEIEKKLQEIQDSLNKLNNAKIETNSNGKIDINVTADCDLKNIADDIKKTLSKNFEECMKECGIVEAELLM